MNNKEKLKKESNNGYFSYYHENLKFYFTGFCIALGLFIILFVLGVISFNSTPQLLNNPKTLYYVNDNAFGEISTGETEINQTNKIKNTIIAAYPILYHIGENQIPSLNKSYYIIREGESRNVSINPIIKYLRLPEIKTKAFEAGKVENILFKTATGKYYVSIDLNHNKIEIFNANEEYVEQEKEFTDKEIFKSIKTELTNLGLTLKYYGDPILTENSASEVTIFYPRMIDDKEVWSSDKKQEGLTITFDRNQGIITDVYNYDVQSYELSKYQLQKTKKQILETLGKEGNIDTTKKGQEGSIPMEKGKLIYLEQEGYLVPAILFKPKANIEKNIITPLF